MSQNKPLITARTAEEFETLNVGYKNLPSQVQARVEFISQSVSKPEYILKKDFEEYTKVVCTDGIYSIEHCEDYVKIRTEYGIFTSKVSPKGFVIDIHNFNK